MPSIPALGSRQYQTPTALTSDSKSGNSSLQSGNFNYAGQSALDHVALSTSGLALSAQGLSDRADALGNATVDVAQQFIASFAQQLFGDAANGASLSFDSASLETSSQFSALLQHTAGASGTSDGAALSLNDSTHFLGKGTITTADGLSFDFEIEVSYTSRLSAAASQESSASADSGAAAEAGSGDDATAGLPTAQLPNIDFAGSLDDLFKLIGQQLQANLASATDQDTPLTGADANGGGTLKLRLLNLINQATTLNQANPGSASAVAPSDAQLTAKAVADAYGVTTPAPLAADNLKASA